MIMRDNFDLSRLEQKAEVIKDLDQQIAKKEEELESIKIQTMEALGQAQVVGLCECGAPISKEVKFCGKCGKKVLE